MKFFFLLLSLIAVKCFSQQSEIINAISGIETKVLLDSIVDAKKIKKVTVSAGTIRKGKNTAEYFWKVCDLAIGSKVFLFIYTTDKQKFIVNCKASHLGPPEVELNLKIKTGVFDTTSFTEKVGIRKTGSAHLTSWKVTNFITIIKKTSGEVLRLHNLGNSLSKESKEALAKCTNGDSISFTNFKMLYGCNKKPIVSKQIIKFQ